ncbi:MAG: hypothetical protein WDZ51_00305 [Pirellulaceae bacterium]
MNDGKWRVLAYMATTLPLMWAAGCGEGDDRGYTLTGTVTYQGKPVPGGRIVFEPITAQGNSGPGSVAEIQDGSYRTRRGKGIVGGPHHVTIFGDDGGMPTEARDNALFPPYRTEVDLPYSNAEHHFDVLGK